MILEIGVAWKFGIAETACIALRLDAVGEWEAFQRHGTVIGEWRLSIIRNFPTLQWAHLNAFCVMLPVSRRALSGARIRHGRPGLRMVVKRVCHSQMYHL